MKATAAAALGRSIIIMALRGAAETIELDSLSQSLSLLCPSFWMRLIPFLSLSLARSSRTGCITLKAAKIYLLREEEEGRKKKFAPLAAAIKVLAG